MSYNTIDGGFKYEDNTVFELNNDGTNVFSANVQGGYLVQTKGVAVKTPRDDIDEYTRLFAASNAMREVLKNILDDFEIGADPYLYKAEIEKIMNFIDGDN